MDKVPEIISVTDLRQNAAGLLKRLKKSREPLVITQRGRPIAVLLSLDAYERSRQELEILRLLARGENEIASGKGLSLDSVLKDADGIIEVERA